MMKHNRNHKRSSQAGNIFFMLFASVALIGAVAVGANNTMKGIVTSMSDVTRKTIAEEKMMGAARLSIQASTVTAGGNCDGTADPSDVQVEPLPFRTATGPHPEGGGWLPVDIGATEKDPWGTNYGYCVWDPGPTFDDPACGGPGANRLDGSSNASDTVVAVISAGKDRKFSTTCGTAGGGAWSPADLAVPPLVWFDAQTPASIAHTAGAVTTWTDRQNSQIATLDPGSASPVYSTTGFNGTLPAVTFSGNSSGSTGQRLRGSLPAPTGPNAFAFVVMDYGTSSADHGQVTGVNAGGSQWGSPYSTWIGHRQAGLSVVWGGGSPAILGSAWSSTGDIMYAGVRSATDEAVLGMNGTNPSAGSNGWAFDLNATTNGFYIGGDAQDNDYHSNGAIGEIIWLGYEPNTTDRQNIEGYLAHKWGLEAKLPGGHPYKAAPPGGGGSGGGSSVTRAAGSDDIILEYTYADAAGIGGEDLWKIKDVEPDTAMIDKNIEVAGTTEFGGALNLMGSGLILPDSTVTGACDAGTDQQLRMNFTVSPPELEICDYGAGAGLGWTAMAMAGGGGAPTGWSPPANLIAHWKMDETSGTTIVDAINGNNATFTGAGSVTSTTGKEGTALSFDGSNDESTVADNALWDAGEITLSAWVRPTSATGWRTVISRELGITDYATFGILIEDISGQHKFAFQYATNVGTDNILMSTTTAASVLNQWTHVAVTSSATQKSIYINGILENTVPVVGSGLGTILSESNPLGIGAGYNAGNLDENFAGDIDDLMMYSRALTGREVMDIYRNTGGWEAPAGSSGGSGSSSLVARWAFDEGSGTTTADSSGNGHDGTLTDEGGSLPLWNSGHIGAGSLTFDLDNSVRVPDPGTDSDLDFTTGDSITIMAWIKPDPLNSQWGAILNKGTVGSDDSNYSFWQGNGAGVGGSDLSFVITSGNGNYSNMGVDQSVLTQGVWQHVAVTFTFGSSSTAKFYVNGVEYNGVEKFGDMDSVPTQNNAPILLGHTNQPDPFNYQGGIDDVRLYKGILSGAQIAAVYAESGGSTNPGNAVVANVNKYRGKLSSGDVFACGIKPDASLWCWGRDAELQLGNGTVLTATTNSPSKVNSGDGFTEVAASNQQACALKGNGTLWCWGANSDGRLGLGDTTPRASPTQVGTAIWTNITMGTSGGCGVQVNGAAYCWGAGTLGKLGNNSTAQQTSPVAVNTASGGLWRTLSAGHEHTCGIKTDGSAWCWGSDGIGRLGDNATLASVQVPKPVAEQGPWINISAGENHTCAVKVDGSAWCWGQNSKGQLGIGAADATAHPIPERVADPGPWLSIAAGEQSKSTCGIKTDGTMWCWGEDINGRLGNGSTLTADQISPSMVSDPGPWVDITFGAYPCGMKADGSAWCWGPNSAGQAGALGTGNYTSIDIPGRVVNFPDVPPFRYTGNTTFEAAGTSNIAMGTSGISYDGASDATPLPDGLSFPGSGRTRLRYTGASSGASYGGGPVGWWKFDDGAGTSIADATINGSTGTAVNGPTWVADRNAVAARAMQFDNANDYVEVASNSIIDVSNSLSLSFWLYPVGLDGQADYIGKVSDPTWQWSVQMNGTSGANNLGMFWYSNDDVFYFETTPNLVTATWYHIVFTYDESTKNGHIYINGTDRSISWTGQENWGASQNGSGNQFPSWIEIDSSSAPLRIGHDGYVGSQANARIDDVMLFNRAISSAEALALYNGSWIPDTNGGGGSSSGAGSDLKVQTLATNSSAQFSLKAASPSDVRSVGIDYATGGLEIGLNNGTATNWMNAISPQMEILPTGNVGVGTSGTAPFRLNINGGLKVGNDTDTCTPEKEGTLKYVSGGTPPWLYCDGTDWSNF